MAKLTVDFHSDILGTGASVVVVMPESAKATRIGLDNEGAGRPARGWPCLWLLHGLSDDQTTWTRRTAVERYAAGRGIAVVMPAAGRSFYTDMHRGPRWFSYLADELPAVMRDMLPLSPDRRDNFVAGLSMGGYGACKLALTYPDRYAAAASLSGALDVAQNLHAAQPPYDRWQREMTELIFGDPAALPDSPHDLKHLARDALDASQRQVTPLPNLFLACGTDDFLYDDSISFRSHLQDLNYPHVYMEHPGEAHDWAYWDRVIQDVLDWLPVS